MTLLFFLIFVSPPLPAQKFDPGFYLAQAKTANCERIVRLSHRKKHFVCLPPKPIIATDQFIGITGIVIDEAAGISYADLTITEDAVRVLKALSSSFRGSTMVLMLNDRLAGILNYNKTPLISGNQIRISVDHRAGSMTQVHSELKAIVEQNAGRQ